jgi:predicted nucleic acid-binding protein
MSGYLLDTNCISELARKQPEPRVIAWFESVDEDLLHLSVLTIGEIRRGIALLAQSARRTRLESWLDVEVRTRFAQRILPIDSAVADRWGVLNARAESKGRPLSTADGLLAATAIQHDLTLVSRNEADFAAVAVVVLNPWKA